MLRAFLTAGPWDTSSAGAMSNCVALETDASSPKHCAHGAMLAATEGARTPGCVCVGEGVGGGGQAERGDICSYRFTKH